MTHLVVNDGQFGANRYPIGPQLAPIFNNPPWRFFRPSYLFTHLQPEHTLIQYYMLYIKRQIIVKKLDPAKSLDKEIIQFENTILDNFCQNFDFRSSTICQKDIRFNQTPLQLYGVYKEKKDLYEV